MESQEECGRRSQVKEQLDFARSAVRETSDHLGELLKRLKPVLRSQPEPDTDEQRKLSSSQSELVQVASELREMYGNAATNNAAIIDALDRLEL